HGKPYHEVRLHIRIASRLWRSIILVVVLRISWRGRSGSDRRVVRVRSRIALPRSRSPRAFNGLDRLPQLLVRVVIPVRAPDPVDDPAAILEHLLPKAVAVTSRSG